MKGILNESEKNGVPGYVVAMKMPKGNSSQSAIDELKLEAAIMAQFSHPNIVGLIGQVNETFLDDTSSPQSIFILVAQFCEFGSLLHWLRGPDGNAAPIATLTRMSLDVSLGMVYLSSKGIVHRDLAARNVLVASDLSCKISDFGFAKHTQEEGFVESNTQFQVSYRWLAPEVFDTHTFTVQSDVWSFAVLMWEMFTYGKVPYESVKNFHERNLYNMLVNDGYRLPKPLMCPPTIYEHMAFSWNLNVNLRPDFPAWMHCLEKTLDLVVPLAFQEDAISSHTAVHPFVEIVNRKQEEAYADDDHYYANRATEHMTVHVSESRGFVGRGFRYFDKDHRSTARQQSMLELVHHHQADAIPEGPVPSTSMNLSCSPFTQCRRLRLFIREREDH
jgi:serine/threonine protein kinase